MTLSFSTKLNGKPTHFVEKIWQGLLTNDLEFSLFDLPNFLENVPGLKDYKIGNRPAKLHTIRKDEKDRWKAGKDIHMVINNRTPKRCQFAPVVKCVSTQEIKITWEVIDQEEIMAKVYIEDKLYGHALYRNCRLHAHAGINTLALNDGFKSVEAFLEYFSEDFTGKIIHWTNLKY